MKTRLLFLSLALIIQNAFSQCDEQATDFGNNSRIPSYNIKGDVTVTYNANESVTITLGSNFSTAAGPDVRVYLIDSKGRSDSQIARAKIRDFSNRIAFGLVDNRGRQTFTENIPNNIDISDMDKVFFYCLQFDQFWDFGSFESFTEDNCSILTTEDNALAQNISIFPNPVNEQFEVRNDLETPVSIAVYDVLGKQVQAIENSQLKRQAVSLSNLNAGIYLVEIKSDKQRLIKKLIKQ